MKTILVSCIRTRLVAASSALFLLSLSAVAKDTTANDRVSQLLASQGSIPVKAAGPYVEVGTYPIQVSVKLGRPNSRLPDGAWLYENFQTGSSSARGTLIVRFHHGRVSSLSLATPAVVASLVNPRLQGNATTAFASTDPR